MKKNNLKEEMDKYLERPKISKKLQKICKEVEDKLGFLRYADETEKRELAIIFMKGCLDDLKSLNSAKLEKASYQELPSLPYI